MIEVVKIKECDSDGTKFKAAFDSNMAHARRSFTAAQIAEAIMEDDESEDDNSTSSEDDSSDIEREVEEDEPSQEVVWKKLRGMEFHPRHFPFSAHPGVNVVNENSVYSLFRFHFTNDIVRIILEQTNMYMYAAQLRQNHPNRHKLSFTLRNWKPLDEDEFFVYLAAVFLMGIIHKPCLPSYWTTNHKLCTPFFAHLVSRDRFLQIRRVLHFNNNEHIERSRRQTLQNPTFYG